MAAEADATNCVEAMADATEPLRKPESERGLRILGRSRWRNKFRTLAAIQITTGSSRLEQRLLATVRTRKFPRTIPTSSHLTEPPDADPHVRWCGRGAYAPLSRLQAASCAMQVQDCWTRQWPPVHQSLSFHCVTPSSMSYLTLPLCDLAALPHSTFRTPNSSFQYFLSSTEGAHKVALKLESGFSCMIHMLMSYASFMCLKQKRASRPAGSFHFCRW